MNRPDLHELDPTSSASGEQSSTRSANDSTTPVNNSTPTATNYKLSSGSYQNNTNSHPFPSPSSDPKPATTPAPVLAQAAAQASDMDSSTESFVNATHTITRHVHFRSTAEIATYVVQTPVGTPPCSPRTIRRKLRRRRLFFSHQVDISCGRSTLESREKDAVEDLYEGRYSMSDDFRRWRQQQEEEAKLGLQLRQISQLKRSNTYPYPADRSISKETACGYYRISPSTYDVMNRLAPMPGQIGPVRTTRPPPTSASSSSNMRFDGRNIRHPREDLTLSEITDMLTEASIQPSPWWDVELLSLDFEVSVTQSSSSAAVGASIPVPTTASAATDAPTQTPTVQTAFNYIPVSFPQGAPPSISSLFSVSFPHGVQPTSSSHFASASHSSSSSSSRSKHRSAPIFSKQSRQPSSADMAQMSDAAREVYLSVAAVEVDISQRKKNGSAGSSKWIKTISNLVRPKSHQGTASQDGGDGNGVGSGSRSMRNPSSSSSSQPLRPMSTSSSSRPISNTSPFSQSISPHSSTISSSNLQTSRPFIPTRTSSQCASTFRDPSGLAIIRRIAANSNSAGMQLQSISASISQFPNPRRELDPTVSSMLQLPQPSIFGGDSGYDSSTLFSSGPTQSSRLTSTESEGASNSYLPPLPAAMSPILPSVISASNGIVASNSLASKENSVVNTTSQLSSQLPNFPSGASRQVDPNIKFPDAPSNMPRELNSSQRKAPGPRTESEIEDIRHGKQMDGVPRSNNQPRHEEQDLEDEDDYPEDYSIDEEYYIEDDENEDELEEEEGEGAGEEESTAAGGEKYSQGPTENGKTKQKKKTLLQRMKKGFSLLKAKKTRPSA
ncbi:hypothetical protein BGW39_007398 [Mortierella sp. 14UC]|nr:hypothetical protein BGW39_007398 [Mortierella sp. 14UC]